jgi:hypothetical protein
VISPAQEPVSAAELAEFLSRITGGSGFCIDNSYLLPALNWVAGGFTESWFEFKNAIGAYSAEDNDCDDFARGAAFLAQVLHHNTPDRAKHVGLAFGEFCYISNTIGSHAINMFVCREDGALKIGFYEPQTCSVVELTPDEIGTCFFYRI